jgi:hypothetical protein
VSLNFRSPQAGDVSRLLSSGRWSNGDQLKDPENQTFYNYANGQWNKSRSSVVDSLTCERMYYILSHQRQTVTISSTPLASEDDRRMTIRNNWNYIGYTPMVNLPLNTALQDFSSKVRHGDIIKSQDEFAVYDSESGWQGNLHYMKPGQGYMLKHNAYRANEVVGTTPTNCLKATSHGLDASTTTCTRGRSASDTTMPSSKLSTPQRPHCRANRSATCTWTSTSRL